MLEGDLRKWETELQERESEVDRLHEMLEANIADLEKRRQEMARKDASVTALQSTILDLTERLETYKEINDGLREQTAQLQEALVLSQEQKMTLAMMCGDDKAISANAAIQAHSQQRVMELEDQVSALRASLDIVMQGTPAAATDSVPFRKLSNELQADCFKLEGCAINLQTDISSLLKERWEDTYFI